MDGLQGDFLEFQFNGVTSKELGITRVSDGDRYQDTLTPEINDRTVEIPGVDGVYFYGSDFKQRNFPIKVAFDGITEEQLKKIKRTFAYKHIGGLIFNEWPYKFYRVKVASPPELDYVCFDEQKKTVGSEQKGIRIIDREYAPQASIKEVVGNFTATVDSETFISQLTPGQEVGEYLFNGISTAEQQEKWCYNGSLVSINLQDYGITYDGTLIEKESETTVETYYESPDCIGSGEFNDLPILLGWDEEMTFTFNGQDYVCPRMGAVFFSYGAPYVNGHYDYTEYPFHIAVNGSTFEINTPEEGTHTISVHYAQGLIIVGVEKVLTEPVTWEQVTPWVYTGKKQRIYKGEGTIEFVAYYPFARQKYRILDTYVAEDLGKETVTDEEIDEWLLTNQWAAASGIQKASWFSTMDVDGNTKISTKVMEYGNNDGNNNVITLDSNFIGIISVTVQGVSTTDYTRNNNVLTFDTNEFPNSENNVVVTYATNRINVYNPGDLPTGFRLYLPFDNNKIKSFTMTYDAGSYEMTENHVLNMQEVTKKDDDIGIQINTTNGLIEGVSAISNMNGVNDGVLTSGNIYNEYVTGEFFKIVCSDGPTDLKHIDLTGQDLNTGSFTGCQIYYNYLYL